MNWHVKSSMLNKKIQKILVISKKVNNSNIGLFAAASSFYFLLTIVPFILLVTKVLSLMMGPNGERFDLMSIQLVQFIPPKLEPVFNIILDVIRRSLFSKGSFTIYNIGVLILSVLGFSKSIWQAMNVITNAKRSSTFKRLLKDLGFIGITTVFFFIMYSIPIFLNFLRNLSHNEYVYKVINILKFESFFNFINSIIFGLNIMTVVLIMGFMTLIFKYILPKYLSLKEAFCASIIFTILITLLKTMFFYYIAVVEKGLIRNYGGFYTIFLFLIWIYASVYSFYLSIILMLANRESKIVGL